MAKGIAGTCGMRTVTNLRIMASNDSKYIARKYLTHCPQNDASFIHTQETWLNHLTHREHSLWQTCHNPKA